MVLSKQIGYGKFVWNTFICSIFVSSEAWDIHRHWCSIDAIIKTGMICNKKELTCTYIKINYRYLALDSYIGSVLQNNAECGCMKNMLLWMSFIYTTKIWLKSLLFWSLNIKARVSNHLNWLAKNGNILFQIIYLSISSNVPF